MGLTPRIFSSKSSKNNNNNASAKANSRNATPKSSPRKPLKIEFRLVFRANGAPCDPFAAYSRPALDAALAAALPDNMEGTIAPSSDSKNQPAVLVRASAASVNSMYELRSQVVSGEFMVKLTRSLKIQMREERRSLQVPSTRDDDQLIEKTEAGALDLTMTSDEDAGMWEKLKFNWPWQEQTPESTTKTIKRELKEVQSQLADRRKQVAELESRAAELIERLATEARSLTPREAVVKEPETGSQPADEEAPAALGEEEDEAADGEAADDDEAVVDADGAALVASAPPPASTKKVVGPEHVALDELTDKQREQIEELSAKYVGAGGKLDKYGDIFILRFLVANHWKMEKAEKQLLSTAKWRKRHHADEFRAQIHSGLRYADIPHMRELYTCVSVANYLTETKAGDIMTIIDYGSLNVDRFFSQINNAEYFDINTFILEYVGYHADKTSRERGHLCRQAICIDAEGIGLKHVSLRMFIRFKPVMPLADLYYPELLGAVRVLNAAWALHQGWKLVKPLLSKDIQAMVKILDKAHSPKALTLLADAKDLPPCYDGTATELPARFVASAKMDDHPELDLIAPGKKIGVLMRASLAKSPEMATAKPASAVSTVPQLRTAGAA